MNRRANSLTDLIVFMIMGTLIIVFCGVMVFVGSETYSSLMANNGSLQNALGSSGNATQIIDDTMGGVVVAYQSLPWSCLAVVIGLVLSIFVTSFLVRTNPIWFVPYILVLLIDVIVSVPISNAYEMIYLNPVLASSFSGFMSVSWIWLHLPIWVTVIGFVTGILMFVNINKSEAVY